MQSKLTCAESSKLRFERSRFKHLIKSWYRVCTQLDVLDVKTELCMQILTMDDCIIGLYFLYFIFFEGFWEFNLIHLAIFNDKYICK